MIGHRVEHLLLLRTLRPDAPAASLGVAPGAGIPDWDYALRVASRMGTLPLLASAAARARVAPDDIERRAFRERLLAEGRALAAERALRAIDAAFADERLEFMVLKGLPLACELYSEPGLRPFDDIDLLVRRADREPALRALARLGYGLPPGSFRPRFYLRHHFHLSLVAPGTPLPVELHWDLQPRLCASRIDTATFWERPRLVRAGGLEVRVPGREENFLYLIQHLSRHLLGLQHVNLSDPVGSFLDPSRQGRLIWLADVALLARSRPAMDWTRIEALAARWGLARDLDAARLLLRRIAAVEGESYREAPGDAAEPAAPDASGRGADEAFGGRRRGSALSRHSAVLQFRPILALHALRYAFPGRDFLRARHRLRRGSPRVGPLAAWHAVDVLARLGLMAAAVAHETVRLRALRPRRTAPAGRADRHVS